MTYRGAGPAPRPDPKALEKMVAEAYANARGGGVTARPVTPMPTTARPARPEPMAPRMTPAAATVPALPRPRVDRAPTVACPKCGNVFPGGHLQAHLESHERIEALGKRPAVRGGLGIVIGLLLVIGNIQQVDQGAEPAVLTMLGVLLLVRGVVARKRSRRALARWQEERRQIQTGTGARPVGPVGIETDEPSARRRMIALVVAVVVGLLVVLVSLLLSGRGRFLETLPLIPMSPV